MSLVRYTDPLDLRALAPALLAALEPLRLPHGHFRKLLAERPEALVVVALDEAGAIGWAAVEPSGLVGAFVRPDRRREAIGSDCLVEAYNAARARWPELQLYALPNDRAGTAFYRAAGFYGEGEEEPA